MERSARTPTPDGRGATPSGRLGRILPFIASMRQSSLFPVLLLAIILAVLLPMITAGLVSPTFTEIVVDSIREDARRLGHLVLPPSLKHSRLRSERLTDRFFAEIYRLEHDFGLMKVKIFAPSGEVLYSTDLRETGTVNSHPYFMNEVAKGIQVTKFVKRGTRTMENLEVDVDVVETYVPFMAGDRFLGAFEMYYDVSKRMDRLNRLTAYSTWVTALLASGLALLMGMLTVKDVAQHRAQREMETLKADVERITRHDLKAPIAGMLGGLDFLRRFTALDKEQADMVEEMRLTANTAMDLINRSLDLYKMETGKYQYAPSAVNLIGLARRAVSDLAGLAQAHGVRILFTKEGKEPGKGDILTVDTDATLAYSLLANLLKNAIEASPGGGQVTLTLTEGRPLRLTVHNQGTVPEAIRSTFFDKYKTVGKQQGTGLGTYSAKLITETLGGTIDMTTSEERGTMLTVTLPARPDPKED